MVAERLRRFADRYCPRRWNPLRRQVQDAALPVGEPAEELAARAAATPRASELRAAIDWWARLAALIRHRAFRGRLWGLTGYLLRGPGRAELRRRWSWLGRSLRRRQ